MSETAEKKLVGQATYDNIRNDIVSGTLSPNERLKLNELRNAYKASVSTLREILMRLVSDGFVVFEEQKGFRVVPVSLSDLQELVELRITFELMGIKKSMQHSTLEWKSKVVAAHYKLSHMEKLMLEDPDQHVMSWVKADQGLHIALLDNCGSRQLRRYHMSIIDQFMRYQMLALKTVPFRGRNSAQEHQAIIDAVLNDDYEAVANHLREHIGKGAQLPVG